MAKITVRLEVNSKSGNQKIKSIETPESELLNNVSFTANEDGFFDVLSDGSFEGTEMLSLSKDGLKFNRNGYLSNSQDGKAGMLQSEKTPRQYIWNRTNENGETVDENGDREDLTLVITKTDDSVNIDRLVIIGDPVSGQFPTVARLNYVFINDEGVLEQYTMYNDDTKWAIKIPEEFSSSPITIHFSKWNRPNYNACLSGIRVMYKYIELDNRSIESMNSLSETTSEVSNLNYGCIANSGKIEIIDSNGELKDLIQDDILPKSNMDVEVEFNGNVIQSHITTDTDYKDNTKHFSVSISNKMNDLDVLKYKGYIYQNKPESLLVILRDVFQTLIGTAYDIDNVLNSGLFDTIYTPILMRLYVNIYGVSSNILTDKQLYEDFSNVFGVKLNNIEDVYNYFVGNYPENKTLYDIAYDIYFYSGIGYGDTYDNSAKFAKEDTQDSLLSLYKILSNKCVCSVNGINFEDTIYNYLDNIIVEYPSIEYGKTYRQIFDDIFTIAQLRMFVDKDNNYKVVSARPILLTDDKPILITKGVLFDDVSSDVIVKNQFEAVEMSEFNVIDKTDYDTVVYPADITLSNIAESELTKSTKNNQNIVQRSQFISSATFYYEIVSYITSDYYYYTGQVTIPKKSSDNLSQITSVNDSLFRNNNFSYRLTYGKYIGSATANSVWDRGDNKISVSNISYGNLSFDSQTSQDGVIEDISEFSYTLPDGTVSTPTTSTKPNSPSIQFTSDDENYYVTYNICVRKKITKLGGYGRWTSASTSSVNISLSGNVENYMPLSLEFSIYGNKRTISFEEISSNSNNIDSAKVKASVNSNKLLQDKTTFYDNKLSDIIKNNILSDYKEGVGSCELRIACADMNYQNGDIAINKNNGDVLKPVEVVFVDGQKYFDGSYKPFRLFSRDFIYENAPELNIKGEELISVKLAEDPTVELYTWSKISDWSKEGVASQYLKVGDKKTIQLTNGQSITATVIDINHETIESGLSTSVSSNYGVTFAIGIPYTINDYISLQVNETVGVTSTNEGGWEASYLRNTIIPDTIMPLLPESLKTNFKSCIKLTGKGGGSNLSWVTSDKMWVPSEKELTGNIVYASSTESSITVIDLPEDIVNKQYEFFKTITFYGWTRSPNYSYTNSTFFPPTNNTNSFVRVNMNDGVVSSVSAEQANNQLPTILCFCI